MLSFVALSLLYSTSSSFGQYGLAEAFPSLPSFTLPIEMVQCPDSSARLFVVEQRGRIYIVTDGPQGASRRLFLNISGIVSSSGNETGLLGLAFHPDFASNRKFYVHYTRSSLPTLESVVAQYWVSDADPDSARHDTSRILLTQSQPYANHNGGKILFGPDGYLYIALGDGGSGGDPSNNAQNLGTFLGKILRIDVDSVTDTLSYGIPPTNPFASGSNGARREIFSYGMRNPWKMSFDVTGRLWAGDVGQNIWEEIDVILPGMNYGWRIMEGPMCHNPSTGCDTTGLTMPIWSYSTPTAGGSITGGYVYKGPDIPPLTGKYIYADYIDGRIWALTIAGPDSGANQLLHDSPYNLSTFGEDSSGRLLVASYGTGRVYRLTGPATHIPREAAEIPRMAWLGGNFPNPFNGETNFEWGISRSGHVRLEVSDITGRSMAILLNREMPAGVHTVRWDAGDLPSGVYVIRLMTGTAIDSRLTLLLR